MAREGEAPAEPRFSAFFLAPGSAGASPSRLSATETNQTISHGAGHRFNPPQHGQLGSRRRVTDEVCAWYESIIHNRPNRGVPVLERILMASRAANAPIAAEIPPTTGKSSSNGGFSG